jgi:predicted RNase H-like nuclease (RuvC/YqgF family)
MFPINWKIPVVLAAVFGLGVALSFIFFQYVSGLPPFFMDIGKTIQPLIESIRTKLAPILTAWNNLPETLRTLIIGAIPTLFMVFFAWTKTRAMQKLQQVKQEATQQIDQLSGEASDAKTEVSQLQKQVETLTVQNMPTQIQELQTNLTEAQRMVTEKSQAIDKLTAQIDTLHRALAEKEQTVIEKTVVK